MQKEILINSRLPPKNIHERGVTVMKENRKLLKEVQQIPLQNLPEAGRLSFPLPVF